MENKGLLEVVLPGKVEPEGLQFRRGAVPTAGAGQVVVRMEATGVSFAEQQMRRGRYYDQPPFPFVPGYDLVGTVAAAGPGSHPHSSASGWRHWSRSGAGPAMSSWTPPTWWRSRRRRRGRSGDPGGQRRHRMADAPPQGPRP